MGLVRIAFLYCYCCRLLFCFDFVCGWCVKSGLLFGAIVLLLCGGCSLRVLFVIWFNCWAIWLWCLWWGCYGLSFGGYVLAGCFDFVRLR